jgi:glycosyltransferase involved in cell wall biosynthesis
MSAVKILTSTPDISVIVCSREPPQWNSHEKNVRHTIGLSHEYIRIHNQSGRYGICDAYNEGVTRAKGRILVFVHEDVFFMEPGWGRILADKFIRDDFLGLVGVAGTQYLTSEHPAWLAAGEPFLRGRVIHEIDQGRLLYLTVFSWEKEDAEVVAVDGLFMAIRQSLFPKIRFDELTFDAFHFYDLDICLQVRKTHKLIVTWDILVKHLSKGTCDAAWLEAGKRFLEKYRDELSASCINGKPLPTKRQYGKNYNLKGIISREVLA